MNTTNTNPLNTLLIEEEPALFDAANIALNAKWIDWCMAKHNVEPNEAIQKANEQLPEMVDHLTYLSTVECSVPREEATARQLIKLIEDIQCYQRCFTLFADIQKNGWINRMKDSDPSVFATKGSPAGIRTWLHGIIRDEKISVLHATTLATFIIGSIKSIDEKAFKQRFQSKVPAVISSVPELPTMAWVLAYSFRHKVSLEHAHDAGLTVLRENTLGNFKA